jgi:N6-adenosine-specific RNA methylase IME4
MMVMPDCPRFPVILADPPWHFRVYAGGGPGIVYAKSRGPSRHYPTMLTEDIARLPIPATDDAVLFLWACWPTLPDALQVIQAWGFEYKALAWVWVKLNKNSMGFFTGLGYYTRANSEPCLLATRGNLSKPKARDVQALICSPIREHSRKPDEQYSKIERLYPEGPYLELFARGKRAGWQCWGNEVASNMSLEATPLVGRAYE